MQKLTLSQNQLRDLPGRCVAGMIALRELEIQGNSLARLPNELFLLPHVFRIDARQVPF